MGLKLWEFQQMNLKFHQKLEHHDIRWITTKEIDDYPFCPADVEILKKLKKYRL